MAENDYIQVQDREENGAIILRAMVSLFPPPERIWLVLPTIAIEQGVTVDSLGWLGMWEELNAATFNPEVDLSVTELVRRSYSKIPEEDAREMTFVARGALYTPATDDDNS